MPKNCGKKVILILLFLIFFVSCAVVFVPYAPSGSGWPSQVFFDHRNKFPFGGTIDLSIGELETEIEISGHKKEEVWVVASQSLPFYRPPMVLSSRRSLFPQIKVNQKVDILEIRVEERKPTIFPIKVDLSVPQNVKLESINLKTGKIFIHDLFGLIRVNLEKGDLKINNFSGSIEASVMKGQIEVEILDLKNEDEVRLMTEEGKITLFLEPEASAKIEAHALHGQISCEFPLQKPIENPLIVSLNEGKAILFLRTLNGDIEIKKIK
ncbi:MAG: hypothetical protein N3B16_08600 [Candidatus Aminicenantes bacterium]|nr:hypothetical protein [Candidatus Aminicenantes bacterium]